MAQQTDGSGTETGINRRRLLKMAGASAAGLAMIPGSGSAHAVFYGCSQVCTHSPGTNRQAVVAKDGECYCRDLTSSDRNDPDSKHLKGDDVICYEVEEGEAIVGLCYYSGGELEFIPNDNRCAENKADCTCSDC